MLLIIAALPSRPSLPNPTARSLNRSSNAFWSLFFQPSQPDFSSAIMASLLAGAAATGLPVFALLFAPEFALFAGALPAGAPQAARNAAVASVKIMVLIRFISISLLSFLLTEIVRSPVAWRASGDDVGLISPLGCEYY